MKRRAYCIAGNWKMNTTKSEAEDLIRSIQKGYSAGANTTVVCCPPTINLQAVADAIQTTDIAVGAQNCHFEEKGAFTGEISADMIRAVGATYCIVGHSERRIYFGETDETVNKKVKALLSRQLCPIICIGETLQERQAEQTISVITAQLEGCFAGLEASQAEGCVIAYEPVWAIGTGLAATAEQAQEVHAYIRSWLTKQYDTGTAGKILIQYGGSMNEKNAEELLSQPDIDGGLIGGASLQSDAFLKIISIAQSLSSH